MTDPKVEFTNVSSLRPEALGEPGHRTFRILVDSGSSSAVVWLEKEQLFQLAVAVEQLLGSFSEGESAATVDLGAKEAPSETRLEFQLGRLALGYESSSHKCIIDMHEDEPADDEVPALRIWAEKSQLKDFADAAVLVCAAGRPHCPLCGGPIDESGHRCARANGHGVQSLQNL